MVPPCGEKGGGAVALPVVPSDAQVAVYAGKPAAYRQLYKSPQHCAAGQLACC